MRELRFRAWHNNRMCYFDLFTTEWDSMSIKDVIINGEPIMQYTGLKDKDSKEIYEGDIVSHEIENKVYPEDEYITIASVEWDDEKASFIIHFRDYPEHHLSATGKAKWLSSFYEVIGNIYENPELLEGGK